LNVEPTTLNQDYTAWRLADAQAELEKRGREVCIVETAPPFQKRGFEQVWGEARVLRWREDGSAVELLVARELLKELKTGDRT
jgi:hypothetical protein